MNRGFNYYFNKNVRAAAKTVFHGGNLFKFYVSFFTWILYLAIPFLNAVTPVACARRAQIASEENTVSPLRELGSVDSGKSFGAALLNGVMRLFITLGGIVVFAAIGALLAYVGYAIGITVQVDDPVLLAVIFAIPAAVCALVYLVATLIMFAPCGYMLNSKSGKASATSVLTASVQTMKRGGKGTCFLNTFIPYLIIGAFVGLAVGGVYLIDMLTASEPQIYVLTIALWITVMAVILMVFAPVFILTHTMCNYDLFKDIALDPTAVYNGNKGVFIKRVKTNTMGGRGLDSNLDDLFERTTLSVKPSDTAYTSPLEFKQPMHEFNAEQAEHAEEDSQSTQQTQEPSFDYSGQQPEFGQQEPVTDKFDYSQFREQSADSGSGQNDTAQEQSESFEQAEDNNDSDLI